MSDVPDYFELAKSICGVSSFAARERVEQELKNAFVEGTEQEEPQNYLSNIAESLKRIANALEDWRRNSPGRDYPSR